LVVSPCNTVGEDNAFDARADARCSIAIELHTAAVTCARRGFCDSERDIIAVKRNGDVCAVDACKGECVSALVEIFNNDVIAIAARVEIAIVTRAARQRVIAKIACNRIITAKAVVLSGVE